MRAAKGGKQNTMIDPVKIGKRIKALRKKEKLTRKELANMVGVEETAISNYENGIRVPKDVTKIKLASALNSTVTEIFFED